MTKNELHTLGSKLRTQVRGQFFEYIEGTLPLLTVATTKRSVETTGCPECMRRRKAKAMAMRKWRGKQK